MRLIQLGFHYEKHLGRELCGGGGNKVGGMVACGRRVRYGGGVFGEPALEFTLFTAGQRPLWGVRRGRERRQFVVL